MICILSNAALLTFTHILLCSLNILIRLVAETYRSGQLFMSKSNSTQRSDRTVGRTYLKRVKCFYFLFLCINFPNRL